MLTRRRQLVMVTALAALSACPAAAQNTRLVEPAGGFSYVPPAGWQPQTMAGAKYRFCSFPSTGLASTLGIMDADTRLSLMRYIQGVVADARTHSPHLRVLGQGPFLTNSGLHGYRAVMEEVVLGRQVRFVFLSLPLRGSRKLMVFAAWPDAQNARLAPSVDQSLKTFQLQETKKNSVQIRPPRSGPLAEMAADSAAAGTAAEPETRVDEIAGRFSYVAPAGWMVLKLKALKYDTCFRLLQKGAISLIDVRAALSPLPLNRFMMQMLFGMKRVTPQMRILGYGPFMTASGLHGYRIAYDRADPGPNMHVVFYGFPAPSGGLHKLLVVGAWPASENARSEPAADVMARTFALR